MSAYAYVSTVASDAGSDLVNKLNDLYEQQNYRSTAIGSDRLKLESELISLYQECRTSNWDGEGSLPVSLQTCDVALRFIRSLPTDVQMPSVSCAPDGSIEFDWMRTRGRILSVSVHNSDRLAFAWLNGNERGHGVVRFNGREIPQHLLSTIRDVYEIGHARFRFT